jgi:hypothetical protein
MIYAIVSLEKGSELPKNHRLSDSFTEYAPFAWFVSFNGTEDELTDILWPDGKENASPVKSGAIFPIKGTVNGYASEELWDWLEARSKK